MFAKSMVIDVPLKIDQDGAMRIGETRVLLEVVIRAFKSGKSAEEIGGSFPTLNQAEVYAVIAYYLTHQAEVDAYMQQVDAAGEAIRRQFEALVSSTE